MVKEILSDQYNWIVIAGALILIAGLIQLLDASFSLALPVLGVGSIAIVLGLTKRSGKSGSEIG